jgi:hypothetical protein
MMNDRLLELKTIMAETHLVGKEPGSKINVIKLGQGDGLLADFKGTTAALEKHQQRLEGARSALQELTRQYLTATTPEQENSITKQANKVLKRSQETRAEVQELIRRISGQLQAQPREGPYDPELRLKENSVRAWHASLLEAVQGLSNQ